ncbi:flavodoxin family protein [Desulfurivibrio sp. D14AmB]|uniref:flavodoxin family protein n=1 Tax=Desulfurivibrio sp. D14AmB TaxID=3374370 RepID=UPI00376EAF88
MAHPQIIGLSGSPIKNSNTDRLVQAVLAGSGLPTEFVKLSRLRIGPCRACLGCVEDNVCKVNDDFPPLGEKIRRARALVIGAYPPYGSVDGFTKAFLERLYSMRHRTGLNRGKAAVIAITGLGRDAPGIKEAGDQISHALTLEGMEIVGRLEAEGNPECLVCGHGSDCEMSALPWLFGKDLAIAPDKFRRVEDQPAWQQAAELGRKLAARHHAKP